MATGFFGALMIGAGLFGSDGTLEGAGNFMGAGSDVFGVLFVAFAAVLAVPITLLLRAVWPRKTQL